MFSLFSKKKKQPTCVPIASQNYISLFSQAFMKGLKQAKSYPPTWLKLWSTENRSAVKGTKYILNYTIEYNLNRHSLQYIFQRTFPLQIANDEKKGCEFLTKIMAFGKIVWEKLGYSPEKDLTVAFSPTPAFKLYMMGTIGEIVTNPKKHIIEFTAEGQSYKYTGLEWIISYTEFLIKYGLIFLPPEEYNIAIYRAGIIRAFAKKLLPFLQQEDKKHEANIMYDIINWITVTVNEKTGEYVIESDRGLEKKGRINPKQILSSLPIQKIPQ